MTQKLRWPVIAGLIALLAASAAACGADDPPPKLETRCDDVQCGDDPNVKCDPADGVCKCGFPNAAAIACDPTAQCVIDPTPSCVGAVLCLSCTSGQECDPLDGICKCGTAPCAEGELCVGNSCVAGSLCEGVVCGASEKCDAADGICKCGVENPVNCSFGQICGESGTCEDAPCAGVNCGPGSACNPADGFCHCGDAAGPICTAGQTCSNADGAFACEGEGLCDDARARCPGGTVCDPADGACRCGGVGPSAPVCSPGQTCDVVTKQCLGGNRCVVNGQNVQCTNGNSCDSESGLCACGGSGGEACGSDSVCVTINAAAVCAQPCDPLDQAACGTGNGCFLDGTQADRGAFCAPVKSNAKAENAACAGSLECAAGLHCVKVGTTDTCRVFCDFSVANACGVGRSCSPIGGRPEGDTLGYCVTSS